MKSKSTIHSPDPELAANPRPAVGSGLLGADFGFRLLLRLLVILQFFACGAFAASQLQVDLIPLEMRARNGAPIPVEAKFEWDSTHILEGRLEMEFHEGGRLLGRYRSAELALTGGEQKFRMLLPPSLLPFSDAQVEVRMKFVTAAAAMELEPSVVFLPTASERSLVLGWCDVDRAEGRPASDTLRNLLFDRFAPSANDAYQRLLMTSVVRLTPEDLPAQPLAYTAFDVLVLTPDAFKEAGERRLQALARWVNGGGSVCVFVGGGLKPQHLWFLNQLAASTPDGPAFLSDDHGSLLPGQKGLLRLRSGVGRSVIVTGDSAVTQNLDSPDLRKAAAFLWKMRSSQAQAVAGSGHWDPPSNYIAGQPGYARNGAYLGGPASYSVRPSVLGAEVLSRLMPKTVRLIPFAALFGMLALFVVLIGPGDYFLLGLLRRRRWTWVLFPATSIAFTVATVLMANHYLGLRDQRCSLFVVDLAKDGTALRWNRYELVFAARDKQSVSELKDALWAPLPVQAPMPIPGSIPPGQVSIQPGGQAYVQVIRGQQTLIVPNNMGPNYSGYLSRARAQRETEPPLYDGTLPVHYQTRQLLRQWQPQLNRIFSFEPPPVPLLPNWKEVEAAWPDLQKIRAKLPANQRFPGAVCAISGDRHLNFDSASGDLMPVEILGGLCLGDGQGLWNVVSQVSPNGGGNFEDLPAMDPETHDAVLMIVTQSGDDIVVYRRFFYGD